MSILLDDEEIDAAMILWPDDEVRDYTPTRRMYMESAARVQLKKVAEILDYHLACTHLSDCFYNEIHHLRQTLKEEI